MLNFRSLYRHAEEHTGHMIGSLFFLLAILLLLQTLFSPTIVIGGLLVIGGVVLTFVRPLWVLGFLALYLPFESFLLKFAPDELYVLARYASEGLIYLLVAVVLFRVLLRYQKFPSSPIDLPFVLFLLTIITSIVVNFVSPSIAILGTRQIIRFILVFFLVLFFKPSKQYIRTLTFLLFGVVFFECGLGIMQSFIGEPLDLLLLPSEARSFGDITLTSGVTPNWDPGTRIFGTFGRYDRFGNFLYLFLLMGTGFIYTGFAKTSARWTKWLMVFASIALILTFSRASWFAFLFGFLFIAVWIKKDQRVLSVLAAAVFVAVAYLGISGMNVKNITEIPGQTLVERFYESFSVARWKSEYYGLGRVYWAIQTPLVVIPRVPLFGAGPGQYGGGAAAALHNTRVYDKFGLPFGVYGTEGFIDNNWFSLWGEVGTLGLAFLIWMFLILFKKARSIFEISKDTFVKSIAIGFAACIIAVTFNALTSTLLEIRTVAFYFWLYAGFVIVLGEQESKRITHAK